jgi:hypothetical protein
MNPFKEPEYGNILNLFVAGEKFPTLETLINQLQIKIASFNPIASTEKKAEMQKAAEQPFCSIPKNAPGLFGIIKEVKCSDIDSITPQLCKTHSKSSFTKEEAERFANYLRRGR